jgi:hypothetical protein
MLKCIFQKCHISQANTKQHASRFLFNSFVKEGAGEMSGAAQKVFSKLRHFKKDRKAGWDTNLVSAQQDLTQASMISGKFEVSLIKQVIQNR